MNSQPNEPYDPMKGSKVISISLPKDLIKKVDENAVANYCTRSDFIRESLVLRLNNYMISLNPQRNEKNIDKNINDPLDISW